MEKARDKLKVPTQFLENTIEGLEKIEHWVSEMAAIAMLVEGL